MCGARRRAEERPGAARSCTEVRPTRLGAPQRIQKVQYRLLIWTPRARLIFYSKGSVRSSSEAKEIPGAAEELSGVSKVPSAAQEIPGATQHYETDEQAQKTLRCGAMLQMLPHLKLHEHLKYVVHKTELFYTLFGRRVWMQGVIVRPICLYEIGKEALKSNCEKIHKKQL